ncbi:Retrovirus-related Pol polyprotein from transposon 17.6 [Gossypium australe]|uniref:Retrovirus-related Pol polyprotein from transposon 17.6 n=1 Tax=Gossypium australe TaxID=47621 RepID=A0A5B6VZB2_9ROSI|nr:Retrovirus-related Pol polyprotein from transposon 17.6 [Gossypium australe]
MSNYVKFMKDILSKKRKLGEFEKVAQKKERRCFTIPCNIGSSYYGKALCDLGAIIHLMPMLVFRKLGIDEIRPITINFFFLLTLLSLILKQIRTLIDVQKGKLTMHVQDDQVTFNVFKSMQFPDAIDECSAVTKLEALAAKWEFNFVDDPLEQVLMSDPSSDEEREKYLALLEANSKEFISQSRFEYLELANWEYIQPKVSIEEPPKLDLKELPSHLKYVYLGDTSTLHVIVLPELTKEQEEKLIEALNKFKRAIKWTIEDICSISPSMCMHKIILEDGEK